MHRALAAILSAYVVFAATPLSAQALTKVEADSLLESLQGDWSGTFEYLNRDGSRATLPVAVHATTTINPGIVRFDVRYGPVEQPAFRSQEFYQFTRSADSLSVVFLGITVPSIHSYAVEWSPRPASARMWTLEAEGSIFFGGRPVIERFTLSRNGNTLTKRIQHRGINDGTPFAFSSALTLRRAE